MKLYVTNLGTWFATKLEADRAIREDGAGSWIVAEVPTDKAGLLDFLNEHRVGRELLQPVMAAAVGEAPANYAEQAVRFEDAFDAMPLALKLHFASLAMEAARDAIGEAR